MYTVSPAKSLPEEGSNFVPLTYRFVTYAFAQGVVVEPSEYPVDDAGRNCFDELSEAYMVLEYCILLSSAVGGVNFVPLRYSSVMYAFFHGRCDEPTEKSYAVVDGTSS